MVLKYSSVKISRWRNLLETVVDNTENKSFTKGTRYVEVQLALKQLSITLQTQGQWLYGVLQSQSNSEGGNSECLELEWVEIYSFKLMVGKTLRQPREISQKKCSLAQKLVHYNRWGRDKWDVKELLLLAAKCCCTYTNPHRTFPEVL